MALRQEGSRGQVAAELFEQRRGSRCEDKKQTLLALLVLVLYMGAGISGRSWEMSEKFKECSCPQNPVASQGFEYQTSDPLKEPIRVIRTWFKENVRVFLEKLEKEVCELEQLVRDLEEWLDVLLGDGQPQAPCCTHRSHLVWPWKQIMRASGPATGSRAFSPTSLRCCANFRTLSDKVPHEEESGERTLPQGVTVNLQGVGGMGWAHLIDRNFLGRARLKASQFGEWETLGPGWVVAAPGPVSCGRREKGATTRWQQPGSPPDKELIDTP
ncbi:small integral membrane protein 23 [Pteronotus mesoamericanus]|uniref:small integral membrane protein 23 n=1 Tax=Pteronotus mesoamericanus TaxID=1884717 RepID=UPI0023EC019D|nr:small integral membrane protein 23 [Pteronotus parnellii mesoamericanus]